MQKVVQTILFITLTAFVYMAVADDADYEKIYKKQCATCHGNKGDGKGRAGASFTSAPTDFTSPQSKQLLTAERIKTAIRDGVAGTSMVAYGRRFNDAKLDGLTDYIQRNFMLHKVLEKASRNVDVIDATTPLTQRNASLSIGQDIYNENCSACHGDKGQSAVWAQNGLNPPPRNFTTALASEELSRERMITSVTHGRPGTAMMSFSKRLSTAEIESVVDYIRGNFMNGQSLPQGSKQEQENASPHESRHEAPLVNRSHEIKVDMKAPFSVDLKGDVANGKRFYDANCFACHGKKGDGKGPRAHFNYPRPRNFTTDDSRLIFNRPRLFKSISRGKRGSVMPAWNTVLTEQQIADVAEYVFQQFILGENISATNQSLKKKS